MRTLSLSLVLTLALFAAGCAATATDDGATGDGANAASSDADLTADGTAHAVTWVHTDLVGRGVESRTEVAGTIQVKLFGAPLPIASSNADFPLTGLTAQTAVVRLVLPSPSASGALTTRRFFVRFVTQTSASGASILSAAGAPSAGVIVDATVPNALAIFDATYDAATQRLTGKRVLRAGDGLAILDLQGDGKGNFEPFYVNDSAQFGVASAQVEQSDHALHTHLVYVKK